MNHADVQKRLAELAEGALTDAEAGPLRAHLEGCIECRADFAFARSAIEQLERHGGAFLADHPPAEIIVSHATAEETNGEVAAHVAACPTCAVETGAVRAALEELSRGPVAVRIVPRAGAAGYLQLPALAAAVAIVVASYLALVRVPRLSTDLRNTRKELAEGQGEAKRLSDQLAEAQARLVAGTAVGGAAPLLFLSNGTRGASELPRIPQPPASRLQTIAAQVDLASDPGFAPGRPLTITIHAWTAEDRAGDLVWSARDATGAAWTAATGLLGAQVPAERLAPGSYLFQVTVDGAAHPTFSARFQVGHKAP